MWCFVYASADEMMRLHSSTVLFNMRCVCCACAEGPPSNCRPFSASTLHFVNRDDGMANDSSTQSCSLSTALDNVYTLPNILYSRARFTRTLRCGGGFSWNCGGLTTCWNFNAKFIHIRHGIWQHISRQQHSIRMHLSAQRTNRTPLVQPKCKIPV